MTIYNTFSLGRKLEALETDIQKILNNVTKTQNELSLQIFHLNSKVKELEERLDSRGRCIITNEVNEVSKFLLDTSMDKYTDIINGLGITTIEDILLLSSSDLYENGIVYIDSKKIIESAKKYIEMNETFI
jgi:hypothetical protein